LVLSSGFLAFANHSGFLQAVEDNAVRVTGVMGTSAGALTGSMYSAGYSPAEILRETTRDPPWKLLRPSWKFWQGLFSLDGVVERLRELLPATFEELDRDFACAVLTSSGDYIVLDSGPLPEAVAASAAIPFLFAPVHIPGREGLGGGPFQDGGARERVGLGPWRRRLQSLDKGGEDERAAELGAPRPRLALVHLIQRSFGPLSGNDSMAREERGDYTLVTSPKSGVSLLSLGDFEAQFEAAKERTARTIIKLQQAGRTATKPKDLPAKGS
jgi:predicted acylesterase/phospholipase RssA